MAMAKRAATSAPRLRNRVWKFLNHQVPGGITVALLLAAIPVIVAWIRIGVTQIDSDTSRADPTTTATSIQSNDSATLVSLDISTATTVGDTTPHIPESASSTGAAPGLGAYNPTSASNDNSFVTRLPSTLGSPSGPTATARTGASSAVSSPTMIDLASRNGIYRGQSVNGKLVGQTDFEVVHLDLDAGTIEATVEWSLGLSGGGSLVGAISGDQAILEGTISAGLSTYEAKFDCVFVQNSTIDCAYTLELNTFSRAKQNGVFMGIHVSD